MLQLSTRDVYKRQLYTLKNKAGMEVCITNFGGRIVSVMVPDKNGKDVYKRQALESTYAFALNELFGENKIDKFELAKVGQAAEEDIPAPRGTSPAKAVLNPFTSTPRLKMCIRDSLYVMQHKRYIL